ncbi:MAG TPA: tRNA preQ1(34) S-adenosylmethionine ribosyltransferase-isomerase QueA [Desulfobacteraceae bacterium]|nr:tRNA preQ1(34) S-adenosylmethionine ribosyltransferase-isomerase QueA [Desulfobacteraceae bacterium]HPJ68390.1 tRNA preQ1(34) S-adenosylmethionine ribosyltransferase-isomerase QueA [Desulfobacteraceae bacterium]HPQ27222.1 tRNA preQ1(34) S-adenosylmethionine ribosyltransferase-isomerase QueA [Desulfobacteraceae bacterium]
MFDIDDYDYELPPSLIAQVPASRRDSSRLLVVDRKRGSFSDKHFFDLPNLLLPGDLLIVNDTRVVPARLFGHKESGGQIEILVLEHSDSTEHGQSVRSCLLKSSKPPKIGALLFFEYGISGEIKEVLGNGIVKILFKGNESIDLILEKKGHMPLPPYIKREGAGHFSRLDKERYQTVFSKERGAVAAPTAGLHFTKRLIKSLKEAGISITSLTLHVGYGTFSPVRTKDVRKHILGEEFFRIEAKTAQAIENAKKNGGRVIAVGTTVVRALETASACDGSIIPCEGRSSLLVTPGFSFKVVDALVTNFHLPRSSLLFLVSAFAGVGFTREAYSWAIKRQYRFYSYGDAMLII